MAERRPYEAIHTIRYLRSGSALVPLLLACWESFPQRIQRESCHAV
jgi:hypothetical protein